MGKVPAIGLAVVTVVGTSATALRLGGIWKRMVSWGIDPVLSASALPGDDLVLDRIAVDTRTIEIDASPAAVWPWLVQMGDDRGGEYSYSVFGLPHRKGADRIVPEWQDLAVGDPLNEWTVAGLEPERALVLYSDLAVSWSWAFVLEPLEDGRTRFIERIRSCPPFTRQIGEVAIRVMGFGTLLMVRKQMLTIRTEQNAKSSDETWPFRSERPIIVRFERCGRSATAREPRCVPYPRSDLVGV